MALAYAQPTFDLKTRSVYLWNVQQRSDYLCFALLWIRTPSYVGESKAYGAVSCRYGEITVLQYKGVRHRQLRFVKPASPRKGARTGLNTKQESVLMQPYVRRTAVAQKAVLKKGLRLGRDCFIAYRLKDLVKGFATCFPALLLCCF